MASLPNARNATSWDPPSHQWATWTKFRKALAPRNHELQSTPPFPCQHYLPGPTATLTITWSTPPKNRITHASTSFSCTHMPSTAPPPVIKRVGSQSGQRVRGGILRLQRQLHLHLLGTHQEPVKRRTPASCLPRHLRVVDAARLQIPPSQNEQRDIARGRELHPLATDSPPIYTTQHTLHKSGGTRNLHLKESLLTGMAGLPKSFPITNWC
jgi:hypothetical protein